MIGYAVCCTTVVILAYFALVAFALWLDHGASPVADPVSSDNLRGELDDAVAYAERVGDTGVSLTRLYAILAKS